MILHGIDVSNNNGAVDWSHVPADYRAFAAMKASQGDYFRDDQFPNNWYQAKKHGIPRIAYHYFIPGISGTVQADYLHSYVRQHGQFHSGDAIMLDIEAVPNIDTATYIARMNAFVLQAWKQIDKPVFLYTSPGYWEGIGSPRSTILEKCPLWIADYGVNNPPTLPGWDSPAFWQYSETGRVNGVAGDCDLDMFFGDKTQLHTIMTVVPKP